MTLRDLAKNRAEASRDWGISATKNQPSPIIEFEQISLRGYSSRFSYSSKNDNVTPNSICDFTFHFFALLFFKVASNLDIC